MDVSLFKGPATVMRSAPDPVISVGIPVFNARATLERAVDSVLSQTYRGPYEIILADDGSGDLSANLCRAYALRFPDVVRFQQLEHRGVAAARNAIVASARGTYLTWLDADDFYFPTKLEQQLTALRAAEADNSSRKRLILFSDYRMGDAVHSCKEWMKDTLSNVLVGNLRAYLWASMARTEIYREVGPFNEDLHRSEDQDWLLRLLKNRGRIIPDTAQPLVQYHFSTARNGKHVEESLEYILATYSDLLKEKGLYDEFVPRRYWEIAGFYQANKLWEDMWRCRGIALRKDFDRYFPKLVGEMISEMNRRDAVVKAEIIKLIDEKLAALKPAQEQHPEAPSNAA